MRLFSIELHFLNCNQTKLLERAVQLLVDETCDVEDTQISDLFKIMQETAKKTLPIINKTIVISSSNILKGLRENHTFRSLLQRENTIFWDEITLKLETDCIFFTSYQNVYKNPHGSFAKVCGSCARGNCQIVVILHDNPFNLGVIRINVNYIKDNHTFKKHQRLTGDKRLIMSRNAIHVGTKTTYLEQFENKDYGHSLGTIQKAKEEGLSKKMTESEYLNEINICMNYDCKDYIQSLDLVHFILSLYDDEMLQYLITLYKSATWENPLILSCDVSGEIFFFPNDTLNKAKNNSGLLTFTMAADHSVSVLDIMLKQARSSDLIPALIRWRDSLRKFSKKKNICHILCCDFSWPLLNSLIESLFQTNVSSYIEHKFHEFVSGNELQQDESIILIDMLHLVKIFQKAARKKSCKKIANKFVLIFLKILKCRTFSKVTELWELCCKFFGYKYSSQETARKLENVCSEIDSSVVTDSSSKTDYIHEEELHCLNVKGIRKNSKFLSYFQKITDKVFIEEDDTELDSNENYCPDLLQYFQEQYLSLLPFFCLVGTPYIIEYPTSSSVENHFKLLKYSTFKNLPLKSRTPALFLQKLRKWNSLQRKSVIYEGT